MVFFQHVTSVFHSCTGASPVLKLIALISLHTVSCLQCVLGAAEGQVESALFQSLDFSSFNPGGIASQHARAFCFNLALATTA